MAEEYTSDKGLADLDELRRVAIAFVAEHYVPVPIDLPPDEYEGSMHDFDHVLDLAVEAAVGDDALWARFDGGGPFADSDPYVVARVFLASVAIERIAVRAATELEHQVRLFGNAAEVPDYHTSEHEAVRALNTATDVLEETGSVERARRTMVSSYLWNVRDGVIDATRAMDDAYDDLEALLDDEGEGN
jgi:hypothetical protein